MDLAGELHGLALMSALDLKAAEPKAGSTTGALVIS
jgi:hypothetical protein